MDGAETFRLRIVDLRALTITADQDFATAQSRHCIRQFETLCVHVTNGGKSARCGIEEFRTRVLAVEVVSIRTAEDEDLAISQAGCRMFVTIDRHVAGSDEPASEGVVDLRAGYYFFLRIAPTGGEDPAIWHKRGRVCRTWCRHAARTLKGSRPGIVDLRVGDALVAVVSSGDQDLSVG